MSGTLYRCNECKRTTRVSSVSKTGLIITKKSLQCPYCTSKDMIPQKTVEDDAPGYFRCINTHYFKVNPATMNYGMKISCPICGSEALSTVRKKDYEAKGDADKLQIQEQMSSKQSKLPF